MKGRPKSFSTSKSFPTVSIFTFPVVSFQYARRSRTAPVLLLLSKTWVTTLQNVRRVNESSERVYKVVNCIFSFVLDFSTPEKKKRKGFIRSQHLFMSQTYPSTSQRTFKTTTVLSDLYYGCKTPKKKKWKFTFK